MRRICLVLLLFLIHVYCQDYINVQLTSGYKYVLLDDISKITFSTDGSEINFVLTSGNTATESVDDVVKIVFATESEGDVPLPVELVSFTATWIDGEIVLHWQTASEVENIGFEIQRRDTDTAIWRKIGFVVGNGSVSTASNYSFTDKNTNKSSNPVYRLKQIDYDGTFEYSHEISVQEDNIALAGEFKLYNNYPNPFNPETTISYEIVKENITTLKVYDILGKEVEVLVNQNQTPGIYDVKFNGFNISSGVYLCKLESGNYSKLIKMLLVK